MKKTSIITILLIICTTVNCLASGIYYLPDVTGEMSSPSYWTEEADVFMSFDEIEKLNEETISAKGTNMYDLASLSDTVDGIALNEALVKSSNADAAYFLTWTYLENGVRATKEDFDKMIYKNEENFNPESAISRQQLASVLYLYAQFKGYDVSVGEETNILSYDDASNISEYAIPAMQYVIGAGIINGKTISTINPEDNATRAEIAVVLKRFVEKVK